MDTISYLKQAESTGLADGLDLGKVDRELGSTSRVLSL